MEAGNESPPTRTTTILGSFLRGRPRNSSQSQIPPEAIRELSPSPPQPPSPGGLASQLNRRSRISAPPVQPSSSHQNTTSNTGLGLTNMLRRRRSGGQIAASPAAQTTAPTLPAPTLSTAAATASTGNIPVPQATTPPLNLTGANSSPSNRVHRIRLVPHIEGRRSLRFDAIPRDLKEGDAPIRIGRFTDRSGVGLAAINAMSTNKLAFRSKVVSRAHAEIWVEAGPKFLIKDTKSSSGTFLNHTRLSPANTESRPYQMKDGDILQLGVDYQGGTEDIYKSVKIRIEIGREWQAGPNAFNTTAMKNLKTLIPGKPAAVKAATAAATAAAQGAAAKSQIPDCCICLFGVTIRQALFIAPCSHAFHYKCIRPMLETHHPAFNCPLCRTYADLEEDVEVEASEEADCDDEDDGASSDGLAPSLSGAPTAHPLAQGGTASSLPRVPLLTTPREDRDRGAETEVENDAARPMLRITTAQGATPELLDERGEGDMDVDGDDMMSDLAAAPAADSDAEGMVDGSNPMHPHPPLDMERGGSGSARTRDGLRDDFGGAVAIGIGEMGEVGDGDGEVDGTVGGKRKR